MKRSLLLVLCFVLPTRASAGAAPVKIVTVDALARGMKQKTATAVDANTEETRQKLGTIPGAVLLSSSLTYDPAKELPKAKNTKLVFYCLNPRCDASRVAALKALESGYTDIAVLPDGIQGWKRNSLHVERPQAPKTVGIPAP